MTTGGGDRGLAEDRVRSHGHVTSGVRTREGSGGEGYTMAPSGERNGARWRVCALSPPGGPLLGRRGWDRS